MTSSLGSLIDVFSYRQFGYTTDRSFPRYVHAVQLAKTALRKCPGAYYNMPKGIKPSPPQQSSLEEMWKRKKKREDKDKQGKTEKMDVERASTCSITS